MNRTSFRKIWGDLLARKGRTALVSLSIFIGVLGVVTLVSASDLMIRQLNKDLQPEEMPMINAYVTVTGEANAEEDLAVLRGVPGVTAVQGQILAPLYWQKAGDDRFRESYVYAFSDPFESLAIIPTRLVEGAYPVAGQNQLAVEVRTANRYDLAVGDEVTLRILGNPDQPGGDYTETWTVTGLIFHPYSEQVFNNSFYPATEDAAYIAGAPGFTTIAARFTSFEVAQTNADEFQRILQSETPYAILLSFVDNPESSTAIQTLKDFANVLGALGVIAMSVSGFLVINVITNLVAEQRRQIGLMKSMGATRLGIFNMYAGIVIVYGLIGVVPAVILGMPLGYRLAKLIGDFAGTYLTHFQVSAVGVGLGIVMGLAVPVLAAVIPVFNGTRVSILEAMTDLGISGGYKVGPLATLIHRLPIPATIKQSLNNINQKKGRLVLTVITLTLAVTAFIGVSAVFVNLADTIGSIEETMDYQIEILPTAANHDAATVTEIITSNVDEVDAVYPATIVTGQLEGYLSSLTNNSQVTVMGVETTSGIFNPDLVEGESWGSDGAGVLITTSVADQLGLAPGDTLPLIIGGQTHELPIIGVMKFLLEGVFLDWHHLSQIAGLATTEGQPLPNAYMVTTEADDLTAKEVDPILDRVSDALIKAGITATINNQTGQLEQVSQGIVGIGVLFNIASLVMAAVGAIGLLTTLSIAVFERQKEIGVMRSVGAGSSVIVLQFLVEGLLIGILAWVVAAPLAVGLAYGVNSILPFGDFISFSFPVILIPSGLVGVLAIATLASMWPSLMAARKTVSDILRYQ